MIKELLSLTQDYIVEIKFSCNSVNDEKTGRMINDYTDDKKNLCNGRLIVDHVTMLIPAYDRDGYNTNNLQKVWLSKSDILALAERIKGIEATQTTGTPESDLPF